MLIKRANISEEQRTAIEQKQFQPLPEIEQEVYDIWQAELNEIDNDIPDPDGSRDIHLEDEAANVEGAVIPWGELGCFVNLGRQYVLFSAHLS